MKQIVVIGAGLGGISAAAHLASAGHRVTILDKNAHIGGKLNELKKDGFTFDLGPSILTLLDRFEAVFAASGRRMSDYIPVQRLDPQWRSFFEDGQVISLYEDPAQMARELARFGCSEAQYRKFLAHCEKLYSIISRGYFDKGFDTLGDFLRGYSPANWFRLRFWQTMDHDVRRYFRDQHLIDMFDFFIKYVGSSAYRAPAFMNMMSSIQVGRGLWYVPGGMYGIARGLEQLLTELGVTILKNTEAVAIESTALRGKRFLVNGVRLSDGRILPADIAVSNMEIIPAHKALLSAPEAVQQKLEKFEPACSGLVIELGVEGQYPQLAHHNFFFSGDQREHFASVFEKKVLPHDPTVYLVAASRSDTSVAPAGCETIKILPHIPHIVDTNPPTAGDYAALRERVLEKLERMGLTDLRKRIIVEHFWTPVDIERMYRSNRGAIYGVVTDKKKNLGFKGPKKSRLWQGLYFVGGSVNPGGGMPMVILSGTNAAGRVLDDLGPQA